MDLTSWLKRVVFYRMDITFSQAFAYWNEIARDYTIKNREAVWIDPMDYQAELTQAVLELRDWRMDVPIFNLPRCPPPEALWPFARKSYPIGKPNTSIFAGNVSSKRDVADYSQHPECKVRE